MSVHKKLDLSKDLLVNMYKTMPIHQIATELGVSERTIRRRFREYNIETGLHTNPQFIKKHKPSVKEVKKPKPYEDKETFLQIYLETKSLVLVAKHFNIAPSTALEWKKKHNIETLKGVSEYGKALMNKNKPYADKEWLQNAYDNYTMQEIADQLEIHVDTIKYWIKKHGIKTRTVAEQRAFKSGNGNRTIFSNYTKEFNVDNYMNNIPYNLPSTIKRKIIDIVGSCQCCGYDEVLDLHHVDENHHNNHPENHAILCPNCHAKVHRLGMKLPNLQNWVEILSYQGGH